MFKLDGNYEVDQRFLKSVCVRNSPSERSTLNTPNSQNSISIPRRDSVNSLLGSRLRLNFDVLQAATNNRYIDGDDIRLVSEGPMTLFSNLKLQSSSAKHIEEINHAHIVCLMYKFITSARNTDELPTGIDRVRGRRQRELTYNKNKKRQISCDNSVERCFWFCPTPRKSKLQSRLQTDINTKQ